MLELPSLPLPKATRQIICICCNEPFVVVASLPNDHNQAESPDRGKENATPPRPAIIRFYDDNRANMPVQPHLHSFPIGENPAQPATKEGFFNCPRCGADNRNWMQALQRPSPPSNETRHFTWKPPNTPAIELGISIGVVALLFVSGLFLVASQTALTAAEMFFPMTMAAGITFIVLWASLRWRTQIYLNPLLYVGGGVLAPLLGFNAFVALLIRFPTQLFERAVVFGGAIFIAAFVPMISFPRRWQHTLQQKRLRAYLPQLAAPAWQELPVMGAIIFLLAIGIAAPLILFSALPRASNIIFEQLDNAAQDRASKDVRLLEIQVENRIKVLPEPDESEDKKELSEEETQQQQERETLLKLQEQITAVSGNLSADGIDWSDLEKIIGHVETAVASETLAPETVTNLQASIETLRLYESTLSKLPDQFNRRVFVMWLGSVGFIAFLACAIALGVVESLANTVNSQVPSPIYASIARMTRLAAWEARLALEIQGEMTHIQWMHAERNKHGGITLRGIHRDLPRYDENGRILDTMIPAQHYRIETNHWARIIRTTITDRAVPVTVGAPGFVIQPTDNLGMFRAAHVEPLWDGRKPPDRH